MPGRERALREEGALTRPAPGPAAARPAAATTTTTGALLALQRTAGNRAVAGLLGAGPAPRATIQRAVSASATYPPGSGALGQIQALDGQIATAEARAGAALQNPAGRRHSKTQAAFLNAPSPRSWGYCVEEQLNPIAAGSGWATQYVLQGARPDYHRLLNGVHVFADLTTTAQANPSGNHITSKLRVPDPSGANAALWHAADITHSGNYPGAAARPALLTNGPVTLAHGRAFQRYRASRLEEGDFDDRLSALHRQYGVLSSARFTQTWDERARDRFTAAVEGAMAPRRQAATAPLRRSSRLRAGATGLAPPRVNLKPWRR